MGKEIVLINTVPCCKCGKMPRIQKSVGDLWYVRCCKKWGRYEFLGRTARYAIESWNEANQSKCRVKDEMHNKEF